MKKIPFTVLCSLLVLIFSSCEERPAPEIVPQAQHKLINTNAYSAEDEFALETELLDQEIEYEEEMAKIDLLEVKDALIVADRKMNRQARIWRWSKTRYMEKLRVLETNFAILEGRGTPGVFAGEVPEKDVYSYLEYVDSCEEVLELLEIALLKATGENGVPEYVYELTAEEKQKWEDSRSSMLKVVNGFEKDFPSTGSAIQDALYTMSSSDYEAYAKQVTQSTIRLVAQRSGKSIDEVEKMLRGESEIANTVQSEVTKLMTEQLLNFKTLNFKNWFK